jgi:nicotinamidase-related amidase
VVHKRSCDSFFETDLADRLDERSVTHLVVGGCMTQFCVDTTVRRAVSLGYDVTLISDGHSTGDMGDLGFGQIIAHHNATLDGFDAGNHSVEVRAAGEIDF